MSSADAVRSLLARSEAFLSSAVENLSRGLYDVACFEADQAVQILKGYILKLGGSIPRTHSLRRLAGELGTLGAKDDEVNIFVNKNRALLIMLEDSYLRSRYAVEGYDASDAELCLKVAKEVIKFAKSLAEV